MSTTVTSPPAPAERFQTREELDQYIEKQTTTALEKAVGSGQLRVERRVPWAASGPVCKDSAGYSVLKAAAYAMGCIGPELAKEEIHVHQQLGELYKTYGFISHFGHHAFLVPLATAHLPAFDPRGQGLRAEISQKMTAQQGRFDPDEAAWVANRIGLSTKALGTITDTAGGTLVQLPVLGELIDLQRNMEAFANAGAQEIALPPNGRIQFPKLSGGSTAYWVGEATSITESTPATGNLDLQAKKLGIFVKINNELLRFASPSTEGLVRLDMARVAALKADLAMLEGTGGTQIKGLITYSDITTHTASTTGANGDTFQVEDVALMEGKLPDAVVAPTAWVIRKNFYSVLMNRRSDAVSANDQKGPFLFFRQRASASEPPPLELYGTPVVRSSQVSNTRTKGAGSNLTYIVLGYFPDWVVARMGVMEFLASGLGDTALQNDHSVLSEVPLGIMRVFAMSRRFLSCWWAFGSKKSSIRSITCRTTSALRSPLAVSYSALARNTTVSHSFSRSWSSFNRCENGTASARNRRISADRPLHSAIKTCCISGSSVAAHFKDCRLWSAVTCSSRAAARRQKSPSISTRTGSKSARLPLEEKRLND
jgi:HK97 family phage major capsid protein